MQSRTDRSARKGRHHDEARDWLVKLSSGAADNQDLTRFQAWLEDCSENREAFETERRFWQSLDFLADGRATVGKPGIKVGRRTLITGGLAAAAAGIVA